MVEARGSKARPGSKPVHAEFPLRSIRSVYMKTETMAGIVALLVMFISLAGMITYGLAGSESIIFLVLFSGSIAFGALFFDDWFGKGEE